ncbi:MAG: hypothetical protein DBX59_02385 [Bacillota bacterium]|nr:MAG: hypothetical protein DBX59_02385 [Bacillota bacterium]
MERTQNGVEDIFLKVATYNVCHCSVFKNNGNGYVNELADVSPAATADVIRGLNADIVGLNEVYEESDAGEALVRQTEKISERAGYAHRFFALGEKFAWRDSIGNAILSNYEILEAKRIPVAAPSESERLPEENQWYENRAVLKATIDIGVPVTVFATHFGLNAQEKKNIVNVLSEEIAACKTPVILMGDFNSHPDDEVLKPLNNLLFNAAQPSCNGKNTFPSYAPREILDYIFVSREFEVTNFAVVEKIHSDHFPVTAVLKIGRRLNK